MKILPSSLFYSSTRGGYSPTVYSPPIESLFNGRSRLKLKTSLFSVVLILCVILSFVAESAHSAGLAVNCGGTAASPFIADAYYTGGTAKTTTPAIDVSGVSNPAAQTVYKSNRYVTNGTTSFSYILPALTVSGSYTVRLHFAETYFTGTASIGARTFNVSCNGTQVLTRFDILAAAGAANKAVIREIPAAADSSGNITLVFSNVSNLAQCNGIEIIDAVPCAWTPPSSMTNPDRHKRLYNIGRAYCEGCFDPVANMVTNHNPPSGGHYVRESAYYAYGLLMAGGTADRARAQLILRNVIAAQDTNPSSASYGAFKWAKEDTSITDFNSAAFVGSALADVAALDLATPGGVLDSDVRTSVNQAGVLAVLEIMTRNVGSSYSNIALLSAGVAAAGQTLWNVPGAATFAQSHLDAILSNAGNGAIYEYLAPTYYGIDLMGANLAHKYSFSTAFTQSADNMITHMWNEVALSYHSPTGQFGGPCNRSYGENMLTYCAGLKYWIYLGKSDGYPIADTEKTQAWDLAELIHLADSPVTLRSEFSQTIPLDTLRQFTAVSGTAIYATRNLSQYRSSKGCILGTVAYQDLWPQKRNLAAYWSLDANPPIAGKIVGMCLDESNDSLSGNLPVGTGYDRIHFYSQQVGTNALVALACNPVNSPIGTAAARLVFANGATQTGGSPVTVTHGTWKAYVYPISLASATYTQQTDSATGNFWLQRFWTASSDAVGQARVLAHLIAFRASSDPVPVVTNISLSATGGVTTATATVDGTPMSVSFTY